MALVLEVAVAGVRDLILTLAVQRHPRPAASPGAACSPTDRHVSDLSMEEFLRMIRDVVREERSENPILSQVDTHEASGSSSQDIAAPLSCETSATSSSTAIPAHWAHSHLGTHVSALFTTAHRHPR